MIRENAKANKTKNIHLQQHSSHTSFLKSSKDSSSSHALISIMKSVRDKKLGASESVNTHIAFYKEKQQQLANLGYIYDEYQIMADVLSTCALRFPTEVGLILLNQNYLENLCLDHIQSVLAKTDHQFAVIVEEEGLGINSE